MAGGNIGGGVGVIVEYEDVTGHNADGALAAAMEGVHAQGGLLLNETVVPAAEGEAEYVELYNPTNEAIDLADYQIIRWVNGALGTSYPLPHHTVGAKDYVVLTKDAASVTANYAGVLMGKVVECTLPPYPNDGGAVVLADAVGTVVERLDYSSAMHSLLLRNKAGVSLERRSTERPCNEASNWFSASSTAGYGTPTLPNSQSTEYLAEERRHSSFRPNCCRPTGTATRTS